MHFHHLSGGKSGNTHNKMMKYYHIEGQDKANGINVNEFAKEHNLFKFTYVRHPFDRLGTHLIKTWLI